LRQYNNRSPVRKLRLHAEPWASRREDAGSSYFHRAGKAAVIWIVVEGCAMPYVTAKVGNVPHSIAFPTLYELASK